MKGIEPVLLARLLCAMVIVGCISASGVVCIELILTRAVFTSHQHLSSISLVGISHPHLSSVPSADARASPPSQSARMRAQNGPPERGFFQRKVRSSNRGPKSAHPTPDITLSKAVPQPVHIRGIPWRPTFWVPGRGFWTKLPEATRAALRALLPAPSGRKLPWQPPRTFPDHAPKPRPAHHNRTLLLNCVIPERAETLLCGVDAPFL